MNRKNYPITIGDTVYQFRYNFDALTLIEDMTGKAFKDVLSESSLTTWKIVMFAGLQKNHPEIKLAQLGDLIDEAETLGALKVQVQTALLNSLGIKKVEEEPKAAEKRGYFNLADGRIDWAKLQAFANQRLGLSYLEIEDTTPIEFEALHDEYRSRLDLENSRFGSLMAFYLNSHIKDEDRGREPYTWKDFYAPQAREIEPEDDEIREKNTAMVLDAFYEDALIRTKMKRKKRINVN